MHSSVNLLHLQYFYVVAQEQSFSRASQVVKINQSALSRMVKQLEESLGIELLDRQPRGVRLTKAGEPVFAQAGEIFKRVELLQESTTAEQRVEGELRIGCSDLIANYFLADPVAGLKRKWPLTYPIVQVGTGKELQQAIVSGALEFGLFFYTPELPTSLAVTKRWPVRFRLVCSAKHKNEVTLNNFIGSREVDDVLNRKFPTLQKWRKSHPNASIGISSNSLLLHLELVKKGVGISLLPEIVISEDLKRGRLTDLLPRENLMFELKLVQRKNARLSRNAEALLEPFKD